MHKTLWTSVLHDDGDTYHLKLSWDGLRFSVWITEAAERKEEELEKRHADWLQVSVYDQLQQECGEWVARNVRQDPERLWLETKEALQIPVPKKVVAKRSMMFYGIKYQIELSTDGFELFLSCQAAGSEKPLSAKQMTSVLQERLENILIKHYGRETAAIVTKHALPLSSRICAELDLPLPVIGAQLVYAKQLQESGYVVVPAVYSLSFVDALVYQDQSYQLFHSGPYTYIAIHEKGLQQCLVELDKQRKQLNEQLKELQEQQRLLREQISDVMEAQDAAQSVKFS